MNQGTSPDGGPLREVETAEGVVSNGGAADRTEGRGLLAGGGAIRVLTGLDAGAIGGSRCGKTNGGHRLMSPDDGLDVVVDVCAS